MEPSTQPTSPAIPIAIICGFAMIAIAIFFTNKNDTATVAPAATSDASAQATDKNTRPISEEDYILGNPNAPIVMIEYSDYECPFCKQYHATLKQIMDEYGVTDKVAWVYRQFPIADLHPNSPLISEAALCVGDIGGNDAFWNFTNIVYESHDVDSATNVTKLPEFAVEAGVSREEYLSCMNGNDMEKVVINDVQDAINSGAQSTPYVVLIVGTKKAVINGAQSYEMVKGIVQNLIDQLDGTFDPSTAPATEVQTNEQGVPILR